MEAANSLTYSVAACGLSLTCNPTKFYDCSIPVSQSTKVSAFHLPPAKLGPVKLGSFVGGIDQGSSVNCNVSGSCSHLSQR